jgi:N-acyl-D-amino-acid deacylase
MVSWLVLAFSVAAWSIESTFGQGKECDWSKLPANTWTLLTQDEAVPTSLGTKCFAQAVLAEDVDRIYLWGVGGKMRDRATFDRFELESFSLAAAKHGWSEAFPKDKEAAWADGKWPVFRLHGYDGTDGPRIHLVGSGQANVVRFFEMDGIRRPSPIHTFNQACYDSTRKRIVYFGGGKTIALDPATNTWTDLAPTATPVACGSLAWGSLCYDPVNDEILLFGGGLAFNREGAARTWLYDCRKNRWYRPRIAGAEPMPRCTGPIAYDPTTKSMVLFGGYDQTSALNDTWVYHCKERRWEKREPDPSPPPMLAHAAAPVGSSKVLVIGSNALQGKRTQSSSWDPKETWVYDVAKNLWQPLGVMKLPNQWMTAANSEKLGVVFLVSMSPAGRKTFALRYDAKSLADDRAGVKLAGAPPGTRRFKYHDQKESLESAPKPDRKANLATLAKLPANQFIDANPPCLLVSKTWSGATIDIERGEVIYTGGGHSGYSGNDVAVYSVPDNRWSLDAPPRFPPYLEATNGAVYGWSHGARPWSQHTYLWYSYDPVSKKVIYCARPGIRDGETVQLGDDADSAFVYARKKHGNWTWVFDAGARRLSLPSFGRPFDNPWELCLTATPKGVFACTLRSLYRATVKGGDVEWQDLGGPIPPAKGTKYNYEWMPIVYDSKRDRLIHLMGTDKSIEVHARGLTEKAWTEVKTTGPAAIGRELMYLPKSDALLLLSRDRLFTLDLSTNVWRELDMPMPKGVYGTEAAMVYDPAHDVCVLLLPRNFSGPLQTYLFRLDLKTATFKKDLSVRAREAVEKALPGILSGSARYPQSRSCFSCHHQAQPLMVLVSARARGFKIDPDVQRSIVEFSLKAFAPREKHDRLRQGLGHRTSVIGYLLATLVVVDHPPDETTSALVHYMLAREDPKGAWRDTLQRPPGQGSSFTLTAVTLMGLDRFGAHEDLKPLAARIQECRKKALRWLEESKPRDTEDQVFQLRGLVAGGADAKVIRACRDVLAKEQRSDGSWGQLPELQGDAYATGSALVALREAGLAADDPVYVRGVHFLLDTQKPDGSWFVETRAKPVQPFFDNGDPGGKSQFISFSATNWVVLALLEAVPLIGDRKNRNSK